MRTLAGWCVRHRRIVVLLWIAVLVVSIFSVEAAGTDYSNNFSFPHTQSFDAINLLKSVAPSHSGDQEQVVFGTSGDAKLTDPAVGQRINTMVDKINALPHVTPVTSPFDQSGNLANSTDNPNISKDDTVGFFQVNFDKQTQNISNAEAKKFVDTVTKTSGDGLTVAVTGPLAEQANNQSFSSTGLGVLLALIVLLLGLRVVLRRHPPDPLGAPRPGDRHRHHRPVEPRARHAVDLAGAHAPHRAGGGRRLRPLHRDAPSAGPRRGPRRGVVHHQRGQHLGPCRAVRRDHRVHRPARHVRPRGELPLRIGRGRRHRRGSHHGGGPHPPAGDVGLHRAQGHEPQAEEEPGRERPPRHRHRQQGLLAQLGGPRAEAPRAVCRRRPDHHRGHRPALLLLAAGLGRPGHGPGRDTDTGGLRHALQGLRSGLHRAARAGDRGAAESRPRAGEGRGRRGRPSRASSRALAPARCTSPTRRATATWR